jgi:hypothetical protein
VNVNTCDGRKFNIIRVAVEITSVEILHAIVDGTGQVQCDCKQ